MKATREGDQRSAEPGRGRSEAPGWGCGWAAGARCRPFLGHRAEQTLTFSAPSATTLYTPRKGGPAGQKRAARSRALRQRRPIAGRAGPLSLVVQISTGWFEQGRQGRGGARARALPPRPGPKQAHRMVRAPPRRSYL